MSSFVLSDFFSSTTGVDTDLCNSDRPGSVPNSDVDIAIICLHELAKAAKTDYFYQICDQSGVQFPAFTELEKRSNVVLALLLCKCVFFSLARSLLRVTAFIQITFPNL